MKKKWVRRTVGSTAILLYGVLFLLTVRAEPAADAGAYTDGPSSNLWLSVVEQESEARISVTVSTNYGFAVVGSVESSDSVPVSSKDGTILLSNVRVEVAKPSSDGENGEYMVTLAGLPRVTVRNYSTDVRADGLGTENPVRHGLPVQVKPFIKEVPESPLGEKLIAHHWKPIAEDPTGKQDMFKCYRLQVGGAWLDTPVQVTEDGKTDTVFAAAAPLELEAPPDVPANGWNAGGTAKFPSTAYFDVDVQVGGLRNQYTQVEQSLKVGQIGWEIIPGSLD